MNNIDEILLKWNVIDKKEILDSERNTTNIESINENIETQLIKLQSKNSANIKNKIHTEVQLINRILNCELAYDIKINYDYANELTKNKFLISQSIDLFSRIANYMELEVTSSKNLEENLRASMKKHMKKEMFDELEHHLMSKEFIDYIIKSKH